MADHENRSEILLGGLAFLVVAACVMLIPIPFARVLIGLAAVVWS